MAAVTATVFFVWRIAPHYFDLIVFSPSQWRRPPAKEIAAADALADLNVLERILRTGYVGFDYFQQRGTDWPALFARSRAALAAHSDPVSCCDFAGTINELFQTFGDEHLAVWNAPDCRFARRWDFPLASNAWFRVDGNSAVVDDAAPAGVPVGSRLLDCVGRDVAKDLHFAARKRNAHWQFGQRIIYMTDKGREEITCHFRAPDGKTTTAKVAMNWLGDKRHQPSKTIGVEPGETTYVRLGTCRPKDEMEITPFLESAGPATTARAIIMDLRGNSGGYTLYFDQWAKDLFQGSKTMGVRVRLVSETTLQAKINEATDQWSRPGNAPRLAASTTARGAAGLASLVAFGAIRRGAKLRRVERYSWSLAGGAEHPFAGKMLMIVDRGCASACETALQTAREAFDAVVVGTNTQGVHTFIEPCPYRLPKSGLVVHVAGKMQDPAWLDRGELREGRGFVPDVWIDLRDDGAAAREMGDCLADPACAEQILPVIKNAGERRRDISVY
jgi:hypothetical protein